MSKQIFCAVVVASIFASSSVYATTNLPVAIAQDVIPNAKTVEFTRKKAEEGNADAQFNMGVYCEKGWSTAIDATAALAWYQKAAGVGHLKAQFNLALMLMHGDGVPKDLPGAFKLMTMAAEQGDAPAQHNLAVMYEEGVSVPKNAKMAFIWFQKAAAGGNVRIVRQPRIDAPHWSRHRA